MRIPTKLRPLQHAWQRLTRGWDDSVIWGIDYYLAEHMPEWIEALRVEKQGIPGWCFDDPFDDSAESWARAKAKWNAVLDEMLDGWRAAKEIEDREFPVSDEASLGRYKSGMAVFVEHLFDLWD